LLKTTPQEAKQQSRPRDEELLYPDLVLDKTKSPGQIQTVSGGVAKAKKPSFLAVIASFDRLLQPPHLDEREEWTDDQREFLLQQGRKLIAEAFPAAARHQAQHVAPLQARVDNLPLQGPVSENDNGL
jgi:hypothetical protein